MDILSHALWGAIAGEALRRRLRGSRRIVWGSAALGAMPDVAGSIPVAAWAVSQPDALGIAYRYATASPGTEPPMPELVAALAHHAHCTMHSLVIAALATLVLWRWRPRWLPALSGWWLHVAIDIPTHSSEYYPVTFLYPLSDRAFDGVAWHTPWVMALNLAALAAALGALMLARRRRPSPA